MNYESIHKRTFYTVWEILNAESDGRIQKSYGRFDYLVLHYCRDNGWKKKITVFR